MTDIQKVKCMECGNEFEQDMDNPAVRKAYSQMGIVAQQCQECLRVWASEDEDED